MSVRKIKEEEIEETHYLKYREYYTKYQKEHKEERKLYDKKRVGEKERKRVRIWQNEHPEYMKQYKKDNPEKIKVIAKKCNGRRRSLGFNPWNKYFEKCEAHHLNEEDVIYIPKELHRSIWHSLESGQGMTEINDLAIKYLGETWE